MDDAPAKLADPDAQARANDLSEPQDALRKRLGGRVRSLRARRGMTRKVLATSAEVSERHLANLESGEGNPSVQILQQVARALNCGPAELLGDELSVSAEWTLIRDILVDKAPEQLEEARLLLARHFGREQEAGSRRDDRVALIGLRGAGKSTLGRALAKRLERPYVSLNDEIEKLAGCKPDQIHSLYGPAAYRRHERRALDNVLQQYPIAVIDTPGGLVSEAATFNLLISRCFTLWVTASPEEHMQRVIDQGDLRPMEGNHEAMEDLRLILAERTPFYGKADVRIDTAGQSLDSSVLIAEQMVRAALSHEEVD